MKELKFEELSLKQKLGMALIAFIENPTPDQIEYTLNLIRNHSLDCEDIVFLTYTEPLTYVGSEHFTHRIVSVVEAAQFTNRISTVVHFGNPTILEELAHISRYIVGGMSEASVNACLDVLAGKYPAKGRLTYNVNFK